MTAVRGSGDGSDEVATAGLRRQIEDLQAALGAITSGGVDAVLIGNGDDQQLYTLASADRPYRVIVEEMGEGAATISSTGTVLYANLRLASLLGRDRGALLGASLQHLVPPQDRAAVGALLDVAPAATARAELSFLRPDGSTVPALVSVTGLDIDGAVVRCLVAADLTDRRRSEEELAAAHGALQRRADELERSNALLARVNDRVLAVKAELEDAQRVAQVGSWLWRSEPEAETWSPEMSTIFEVDAARGQLSFREALVSRSGPAEAARVVAALSEALRDGTPLEVEHELQLPDGRLRNVLTRGEVLSDGQGGVVGIRGTTQDVTQLRQAQRALADSSAQFAAAFERAPVGIALVGLDRRILRANEALSAMTGYAVTELAGLPLSVLTEDPSPDLHLFEELVAGRSDRYRCDVRVRRADAALRWAFLSVARVGHGDDDYVAFHVEDISDRKHFEDQLQYLADHDPLTGLPNRRRFLEQLEHALAIGRRYPSSGAMALLDLDNFKYINDTLGHPTGDALLCAVTSVLATRLRDSDVLARLGGDEFGVLLYGVDAPAAEALVHDLLAALREQVVTTSGQRARSTASVGIVLLGQSGDTTAVEVLANADLAMYAVKEEGGDGLQVYDATGPAAALSRAKFVWIDRVRRALEEDRFTLLAQPILDLASDEVRGAELLLRMRDDDGLVEPEQFLGIAERHGLSSALDAHVVRQAIALAARFASRPDFRWEINICAPSLGDPSLLAVIESQLELHDVPPASLVFEITETAAIKNMNQARAFASRVTDMGCGFALDDFGAGYGGFYYLKHLPLDYIKIDGEFIRELVGDPTNRVIVQAMVAVARPLGKQTIAEYVIDQDTLDLLRELGVDHAQGHHVGRPVDPTELPLTVPRPRRSRDDGAGSGTPVRRPEPGITAT